MARRIATALVFAGVLGLSVSVGHAQDPAAKAATWKPGGNGVGAGGARWPAEDGAANAGSPKRVLLLAWGTRADAEVEFHQSSDSSKSSQTQAKTHYQLSVEHGEGHTCTWTAEGYQTWWGSAELTGTGTNTITGSAEIEAMAGLIYVGDLSMNNAAVAAAHNTVAFRPAFEVKLGTGGVEGVITAGGSKDSNMMSDTVGSEDLPLEDDKENNGAGSSTRVDCYAFAKGRYAFTQGGSLEANGEADARIRGTIDLTVTATPTGGGGAPKTPGGEGADGPVTFRARAVAPKTSEEAGTGNPGEDGTLKAPEGAPEVEPTGKPDNPKQVTFDPDDFEHTQSDGVAWDTEEVGPLPQPTSIANVQDGTSVGTALLVNVTVTTAFTGTGAETGLFVQEAPGGVGRGLFVSAAGMGVSLAAGDLVTVLGEVRENGGRTELVVDQIEDLCRSGGPMSPTSMLVASAPSSWLDYEGALITVPNVVLTSDVDPDGVAMTNHGIAMDDLLFDYHDDGETSWGSVTGVVFVDDAQPFLEPRSAADLVD